MTLALYAAAHFVLGAIITAIPTLIIASKWLAGHAAELEQAKARLEVLEQALPAAKPKG